MNFNEFISDAWNRHATHTNDVAAGLSKGMALIESNEQIPAMANLITHVIGEHLGQWHEGVQILSQLRSLAPFQSKTESDFSIERSIAALKLASGDLNGIHDLQLSDRVRALAVASSALSSQSQTATAINLFKLALNKASGISATDPANRAIAVTSNNLAVSLEEKSTRTTSERDLMILAAETARKYWAIAGTWLEVERAEYRLANTYAQAGDSEKALAHAKECLSLAKANSAPPVELFFGNEALAIAESVANHPEGVASAIEQMQFYFNQLSDDDKAWCKDSLTKLIG